MDDALPGAIVVHGGCHENPVPAELAAKLDAGVRAACERGVSVLATGGSALDAVQEAICFLEDDPIFDAGTGSYPNLLGGVEMDAMLAASDGRIGGVAAIGGVRHPIQVARAVMERTPHVLLVGAGAERFARAIGVPEYDPTTEESRRFQNRQLDALDPDFRAILDAYPGLRKSLKNTSTVGAVAIDAAGLVAAGTSTGGIPQKLPGRIGDSALFGAGTFASDGGGASASGVGEAIIRVSGTRAIVEEMARGSAPRDAISRLVDRITKMGAPAGFVAMDDQGRAATFHNGYLMPAYHASVSSPTARSIGLAFDRAAYLDPPAAGVAGPGGP